jgi:gluconolactonase
MTHATMPETSAFRTYDPRFAAVLGSSPRLVCVAETDAHEGPVYVAAENALYFTTVPRFRNGDPEVAIKRLALVDDCFPLNGEREAVVNASANAANGMTLSPTGDLLVCEQGTNSMPARISLVDRVTGKSDPVVDNCGGLSFNSPNDVVIRGNGTIWFTDPSYGHLQGFRPQPALGDYVYRHDPRTGTTTIVADDFDKPNGLAFSPDESVLYVGDSGANQEPGSYDADRPHHIRTFDVTDDGCLGERRLFAVTSPGFPDGIKVDSDGRVYASSFSGVQVFDVGGELIGEIAVTGAVNFTFGGSGRNVLFITNDTHTLVLAPGLVIDKVYVGYWFWGRPSIYQLWNDLQDHFRRTKADFDPLVPEVKAEWDASQS